MFLDPLIAALTLGWATLATAKTFKFYDNHGPQGMEIMQEYREWWIGNDLDELLKACIPHFCIDVAVGPYGEINQNKLNYLVGQMHDGIDWLEKATGRKYDDQKLIDAVYNECRSTALWAEIEPLLAGKRD